MENPTSSENVVARIKEQLDIVQVVGAHVDLKKSGSRFLGLCPFHGEKTPSFSVNPGIQIFHCFGCGESGDIFTFMMKYHNMNFPEALKELAGRCNITLPERRLSRQAREAEEKKKLLFDVHERAVQLYCSYLENDPGAAGARAYLENRGIGEEIRQRYRLGYAPSVERVGWNFLGSQLHALENKAAIDAGLLVAREKGGTYDRFRDRILFPIADISGRNCGFGGRIVGEGNPKYLNSPESPIFNKGKLLLGLFQQKDEIRSRDSALLVEGNFDLLSLVAGGVPNVVAPLGTAVTREQIRLLKRFSSTVTLLFDGDAAGVKAAARAAPLFLAEQVGARVVLLPAEHDPDSFIREEGRGKLLALVEEAPSLPEFLFAFWQKQYGAGLDGKTRIVGELAELIRSAQNPLQRSVILSHFAQKLGMQPSELDRHFRDVSQPEPPPQPPPLPQKKTQPVQQLNFAQRQMVSFLVLQPSLLAQLEMAGVRDYLAGTIGEILFLELKELLKENPEAEPEDLLPRLAEGDERMLVSRLLVDPPEYLQEDAEEQSQLSELLHHLEQFILKKKVVDIRQQLVEVQQGGDMGRMADLMSESLRLERLLRGEGD